MSIMIVDNLVSLHVVIIYPAPTFTIIRAFELARYPSKASTYNQLPTSDGT